MKYLKLTILSLLLSFSSFSQSIEEEKIDCGIFPNPVTDVININVNCINGIENIFIYNLVGVKIVESQLISIDVNSFDIGFYVLILTTKDNKVSRRIFMKI
jgi:hypothetical protein